MGPIDKTGTSALAEARAILAITEVLAPLSVEQRRALLVAAQAQLDADTARAYAESTLRLPEPPPDAKCVTCGDTGETKDSRPWPCPDCAGGRR